MSSPAITEPASEAGLIRLSVNLNAESAAALTKIADANGFSLTETVRRAIAVYEFMVDETDRGRHIQTTDRKRKKVREFVLL